MMLLESPDLIRLRIGQAWKIHIKTSDKRDAPAKGVILL
jgi:hypothetical protein